MVNKKTTRSKSVHANDNSVLSVVWTTTNDNEKTVTRNYVMTRDVPGIDPLESVTGSVDFGKDGVWFGYATLDSATNKYMFIRVARRALNDNSETSKQA